MTEIVKSSFENLSPKAPFAIIAIFDFPMVLVCLLLGKLNLIGGRPRRQEMDNSFGDEQDGEVEGPNIDTDCSGYMTIKK